MMFEHVIVTFAEFAGILLIFIFAFGFTFRMLLGNKLPFQSWYTSLLSVLVMMVGESEYQTVFLGDVPQKYPCERKNCSASFTDDIFYSKAAIFILYTAFLILMSIIVMNLMTGLAVDDIEKIRRTAECQQLRMLLEDQLLQEFELPKFLKHWKNKGNRISLVLDFNKEVTEFEKENWFGDLFAVDKRVDPNDYKAAARDSLWRPEVLNKELEEIQNETVEVRKDTSNIVSRLDTMEDDFKIHKADLAKMSNNISEILLLLKNKENSNDKKLKRGSLN